MILKLKLYKKELNPMYFEDFFNSLLGVIKHKIIFGIAKQDEDIFYYFKVHKDEVDLVTNIICSSFELEVTQLESENFIVNKEYKYCSWFKLARSFCFPIKRYIQYEDKLNKVYVDPIIYLINVFSTFKKGCVQFECDPNFYHTYDVFKLFQKIIKGFKSSFWQNFWLQRILVDSYIKRFLYGFIMSFFKANFYSNLIIDGTVKNNHNYENSIEAASDKLNKHIVSLKISSYCNDFNSKTKILSFFKKFKLSHSNWLVESKKPSQIKMSVEELSGLFHFPVDYLNVSKELLATDVQTIPINCKPEFFDLNLGVNIVYNKQIDVGYSAFDRFKHTYIVGKTGMGKSTLIYNMVMQDVYAGRGLAVIDPHGDLVELILKSFPSFRLNDLVWIDPSDTNNPFSFNVLDVSDYGSRVLLVDSILEIFKNNFIDSWGPRLEYYLKNALLLLVSVKNQTLLGLQRLFTDEDYLKYLLNNSDDKIICNFFYKEFLMLNSQKKIEIITPILNKVGPFLMDPMLRNIFGQVKSKLNLGFVMQTKKVLLVNLSKGKIGSLNSNLLGSFLVNKFQTEILSRANMLNQERTDFYLYIDEFQNFICKSFQVLLAEARKYNLGLILANQYLQQLPEELLNSVLGNVANLISFQVGFDDAELLSKTFSEKVLVNSLVNLEPYNAFAKIICNQKQIDPFSLKTSLINYIHNLDCEVDRYKLISNQRYSYKKEIIERKIEKWLELV